MGVFSYSSAALAYAVLALLLIPAQRLQRSARWLVAACAATALWAAAFAVSAASRPGGFAPLGIYLLELLHQGAWLVALLVMGRESMAGGLRWFTVGMWTALLAAGLSLPALRAFGVPVEALVAAVSRSELVLSLLGLVLLEQIYRNSSLHARRQLSYLVLGIGGIFVYDLFMYSQAELVGGVDTEAWDVRGVVNAVLAPLIALAVRRHPGTSVEIFISRQAVFYSSAIVAVGAYLLLMAGGGYYVREIGGAWGRSGEIVFLTIAFLMLAVLVFSESLRRKAKVFINKHFYRNKYDYRLEWLRFIRTVSSAEDNDIGRTALRSVAQILSSPGGILFAADEAGERFMPAAAWPMPLASMVWAAELPADSDLAAFLAQRQWVIDLQEHRKSPSRYSDLQLPGWMRSVPGLRLALPLLHLQKLAGFMLLYDPPPPFELNYEDRDLLNTVGRHIATQLAQHAADRKLAESRQFEAYNRLTAFMMHDLKNSVAQLKLVVENAERHKRNPEFVDDAIGTIANATERITRLIEQLRGKSLQGSARNADLNLLVRGAAERCGARQPEPALELQDGTCIVHADPDKLTSMVEHVIRNAQDATAESGWVRVQLRSGREWVLIEVTDNGAGMEPQFVRERLFKPFDSTKGAKGMGIGAYQVREYARELGGDVEVQSTPGSGTTFSIKLPLMASQMDAPGG